MVNEDPNARIIRELRAEVDALKEMLKHATDMVKIKTFTSFYVIGPCIQQIRNCHLKIISISYLF